MEEEYLTREGYIKLLEELEYLKQVKRREFSKAIGEARAHGDIGENAEYDAAKDAQALNEKRIVELEYKLSNARILEDEAIDCKHDKPQCLALGNQSACKAIWRKNIFVINYPHGNKKDQPCQI